jgi:lysyl-tRNA synthetase, class II
VTDIPYRYERTATAGELHERHAGLPPDTRSGARASVAGRVMLVRRHGAIAFGTLDDGTGRVQLFATEAASPQFEDFTKLSVGDWVGARW